LGICAVFSGQFEFALVDFKVQRLFCSLQALPIALGVPLAGYLNLNSPNNAGYYLCAACSILGSLTLFLVDLHKRNVSKHKDGNVK
jgi:hypothetical protein